ncbi:hypothetical protein V6R21_04125 [Limibacter armeniacum]|uniref:hypothetical protein n=1 Tax=Limibacter armeniacum TaxID=466084 RepID=UPI002FE63E20
MADKKYLKVSDIVKLTGKSETTIRKFIKELAAEKVGEDIMIAQPYRGNNLQYFVAENYVLKYFGLSDTSSTKQSISGVDQNELLQQLKDEVSFLRKQLEMEKQVNLEREKEYRQMLGYLTKVLGDKVSDDLKTKKLK